MKEKKKRNKMMAAGFYPDDEDEERYSVRPDYHAMDMQQLEKRRDDEMQSQEAALDAIHKGVVGIKHHAHAMNNEVVQQNAIIDELDEEIGMAAEDIEKQNAKMEKISQKKAKVCKLYCLIVFLIIVLVLILGL